MGKLTSMRDTIESEAIRMTGWDGKAFDMHLDNYGDPDPGSDHDCFEYGNLSFHAHGADCSVCDATYGYDENGQVTR
jgi:hypothetical protein